MKKTERLYMRVDKVIKEKTEEKEEGEEEMTTMNEIKKMTGKELANFLTEGQYDGVTEGLFFQVEIEGFTVPLELEINSQGYVQTMANMGIITQEQVEDEEADYNELIEDYYFGNEEEIDKHLVETNRDEIIEELEENLQEIKDREYC